MKTEIKKVFTRSAIVLGAFGCTVAGMQLAAMRTQENAPDAVTAMAGQTPVIVLDAGHGESTKT